MQSDLERLSNEYDLAESVFMDSVRDAVGRDNLAEAAGAVAQAAARFNAEAYRRFHTGVDDAWMPLDWLTERTEVLAELWADLAAAYRQ